MKKVIVIMNEQHSLMEEQIKILNEKFSDNWEIFPVPADGWTLEQQKEIAESYLNSNTEVLVFASPVPALLKFCTDYRANVRTRALCSLDGSWYNGDIYPEVMIFHNDKREKKELPNGRIVHTVAQTGWELV